MTGQTKVDWELAGVSTPARLPSLLPLLVPGVVRIRGSFLEWWDRDEDEGKLPTLRRPPRDLLTRFTRLAGATPEDIEQFATEFGVLGICRHGLPRMHDAGVCEPRGLDRKRVRRLQRARGSYTGCERIERWQYFAAQADTILTAAATIHTGSSLRRSLLWPAVVRAGGIDPPRDVSDRDLLCVLIHQWLNWGGVRPRIMVQTNQFLVTFGGFKGALYPRPDNWMEGWRQGSTLFGILAVQLMSQATRTEGWAVCSGCNRTFETTREPAWNRRRYCRQCRRDGKPLRDAQRDRRDRLRVKGKT